MKSRAMLDTAFRGRCAAGAQITMLALATAGMLVAHSHRAANGAEAQQRHLACSRGALEICEALVRQTRLAPGVRAAAEQLLIEVGDGISACDRGEVEVCAELLDRYPDLPPPIRDGLAAAVARGKQR